MIHWEGDGLFVITQYCVFYRLTAWDVYSMDACPDGP